MNTSAPSYLRMTTPQDPSLLPSLKWTLARKPYCLPIEIIHRIIQFIPFQFAASLGANLQDLNLIARYRPPILHTEEFIIVFNESQAEGIILLPFAKTNELDWLLHNKPQEVFDYLNYDMTVSPNPTLDIHMTKLTHLLTDERVDLFRLLFPAHRSKLNHLEGFTSMAALFGTKSFFVYLNSVRPACLVDPLFSTMTMDLAAKSGHTHICRYLHENRKEGCTTQAMDWAAMNGYLGTVKFLHQHRQEGCTTQAMDDAAGNGYLNIVKFLHQHRQEGCTARAMNEAATNGHLKVVKFLHENRTEGHPLHAMDLAAYSGHLKVVKYLLENLNEPCQSFRVRENQGTQPAAHVPRRSPFKDGHMSLYSFLHEQEQPAGHSLALVYATGRNHYHIIEYLAQYATEDAFTDAVNYTAENGNLRMFQVFFKYLTSNHIARALMISSYHSHWDMMNYIIRHLPTSFNSQALKDMTCQQILIPDSMETEIEQVTQDRIAQFDILKTHLLQVIQRRQQ